MKAIALRRTLTGVAGEKLTITLAVFSDQELAEQSGAESAAKVQMLAQSMVLLPSGEQIPFKAALMELGIKAIGQEAFEFEIKESNLIVPQPRIMLASR